MEWGDPSNRLAVTMVNPSKADELTTDPTAGRVMWRAFRLGFGAVDMGNLFGARSTDPDGLKDFEDPVGPENDYHLHDMAERCSAMLVAWGNNGSYLGRADFVGGALARIAARRGVPIWCFKTTKCGQPEHPLYQRDDAILKPWVPPPVVFKCSGTTVPFGLSGGGRKVGRFVRTPKLVNPQTAAIHPTGSSHLWSSKQHASCLLCGASGAAGDRPCGGQVAA